jgi:cation:H+ antiporter
MVYILLIISFVILIKGADVFIEGSSAVAKAFKIPELIIGIVIVGFGTSLPEFAVNMAAIANNSNEMAVGNIVGSNVFNILFIVGAIAIFKPMDIDDKLATFDFPLAIVSAILLPFLAFDGILFGVDANLTRLDGIIFLLIFAFFVKETIAKSLIDQKYKEKKMMIYEIGEGTFKLNKFLHGKKKKKPTIKHLSKDIMMIVIGLIAVVKGGDMVIKYASEIATTFGMSKHLVGLTIVGVGTSLPEFVVCILAARKGQQGIVIGNVVGSNTFNILLTLGASMAIKPIIVDNAMIVDAFTVGMATILVGAFAIIHKKISKITGIILVAVYIAYMYNLITGI